ncbi:hypothetical protein LCGC14_1748440 [marine sediment metagenome]|uniref:ASCH domain-containing protein n=1 Tax=marine sediment metagenome TaxID=412755 RepID=A0A0F9H4M8_9ZZZZ
MGGILTNMDHVAIMKKSWGLLPRILEGAKTIESRWYKTRVAPWDRIQGGDAIYFKDSGAPVTLKGMVTKVLQFEVKRDGEAIDITKRFAGGLGFSRVPDAVLNYISGKRYGILVFFDSVEKVKPFNINKAGFGMMSAWISVDNVNKIKRV